MPGILMHIRGAVVMVSISPGMTKMGLVYAGVRRDQMSFRSVARPDPSPFPERVLTYLRILFI